MDDLLQPPTEPVQLTLPFDPDVTLVSWDVILWAIMDDLLQPPTEPVQLALPFDPDVTLVDDAPIEDSGRRYDASGFTIRRHGANAHAVGRHMPSAHWEGQY